MSLQPGLNLLYEPQHGKVVVDIVFVHGLGGGHLSTWSEGDVCWPRDLLKEDLGDARIFSSAYDSKVIKLAEPTSSTSIAGHAESLLNEMGRARGYLREPRYIIFVCHSLGGLIVKQALIRSSEYYYNSQPYHTVVGSIFPSTLGVIFLGTPHRGSGKATLGKIAAIACKALGANSHILRDLERDSSLLEQQRNSFDSIRPHFQTICLWEELPMSMLGMIVPETSASIDGPEILKEHIPGSNHRSMAKFSSRSQKGYQIILSYLKRCLEKIPHGAPADIADRCILESLKFPGMNQRYGNVMRAHRSVVDSHKSTFDWAFSKNASGFVEWLESNDGLFWINGKAGSGKSTLMKFIAEDPRLKEHLLANNLSLPVFFERFFFWAAGSPEQKSQTGLIKTILHGILTKNRQLIRVTFPDEWPLLYEAAGEIRQELLKKQNTSVSMPTRVKDLLLMSRIDKQTLSKLSNLAELVWTRDQMVTYITNIFATSSTFRTFLFVDGLDEYDGSTDDLAELIALLKTWANMPYVKICVSTRPWTIFETQFGKEKVPSIRLQDFTVHDIADFVADSFNSSPLMKVLQEANPEKIPDFYSSIAKKAEGVFLWVRLVVKSLMDGLLNGEELSLLQERVNELAADLEKLYLQLLQRIPERYWVSSSRLFKIMQVADGAPRSLLLWYAGERNYDPLDFQSSAATKQARCYQVHLRLMSQCAGLLEVRTASGLDLAPGSDEDPDLMRPNTTWSFSTQQDYINSSVHYLHRTTRDFLLKDEIQQLMSRRLGNSSFDGVSWFAIHAFIEVHEVRSRIKKAGQEFGGWGNFGSELFQKQKRFKTLLSQCQNKEVAKTLSSLELKANLFDDTDSDVVTEQIDGDRQEGALNGRKKDELRKRVSLALKYIDSI